MFDHAFTCVGRGCKLLPFLEGGVRYWGMYVPLSTQFIHIIFPQNIICHRVSELCLINSPQNFSRHAPVTKKPIH